MNLRSAEPFWLYHTPALHTYPSLRENIRAEVVVVGCGISGALAAYELVKAGCEVVIISKDRVGMASTCASTSLLQYEIDTPLHKLIELVGRDTAERSYLLCHDSIDELQKIHKAVGAAKSFHRRKSLLLASVKKDIPDLEKEFQARQEIGIWMKWMNENEVKDHFGFDSPAAIYSDQGGETDSYLFTQKVLKWCRDKGARIYDHAEVTTMTEGFRKIELVTTEGYTIRARYAVMATGYEGVKWINRNVARLHSTYVVMSKPIPEAHLWKDKCLIWETAHPYIYLRTTDDHRIIIGGKDEPFASGHKRDVLMREKSKQLLKAFYKKFPNVGFDIDYEWAGTFGETADGLPYIGPAKPGSRMLFSLGYGGNGITFSQMGAVILKDIITRQKNPDVKRYSFERLNYK
ncbi:MAG: dependent oxidoreductase [Bacteroidetes bacterium]|nr:dependent oxidoreductase [Bacteroidota bacterium]